MLSHTFQPVYYSVNTSSLKPLLHFAFGLRFGKVCEQKCEKNATGSRFYPTHRVIWLNFIAFFSCWVLFLRFSSVFAHVFDTNMLVSKTRVKMREKSKTQVKQSIV